MPRRIEPGEYGTVGVKQHELGQWTARVKYRTPGGDLQYLRRSGTTEAEARQRLARAMHADSADKTVREVVAEFAQTISDEVRAELIVETTAARYRYCFPRIEKHLGAISIRNLTPGIIDRFIKSLAVIDGLSASSRRQHRAVLNKMLRPYAQEEIIPRNPVSGMDRIKGAVKSPRALTPNEVRRLMAFLETDKRAQRRELGDLVEFMLSTGCRIGEALGLRWQDVRFGGTPVVAEITGNVVEVTGSGVVRHGGKTTAAIREIELITPIVELLLRRYQRARERGSPEPGDPIFYAVNRDGRFVYRRPTAVHAWIRQARQAVDLDWMTSHSWRKTTVTILHDMGFSDRDIGRITGHAHLTTLRNVYIGRGEQNPNIAPALASAYAEWTAPLELG